MSIGIDFTLFVEALMS